MRRIAAWSAYVGLLVLVGGWVGGLVAVVVGATLLARLDQRLLAALGVGALAMVPVYVLLQGLPSAAQVSPAFVSRSLVPHHLAFAGLALVSAWAVLDLLPHLKASAEPVPPSSPDPVDATDPLVRRDRIARVAFVVAVGVGALAATWAVLQA